MPLLYCQNNVIQTGEIANCEVSRGLNTADILPPARGGNEGNEEKWFPRKITAL